MRPKSQAEIGHLLTGSSARKMMLLSGSDNMDLIGVAGQNITMENAYMSTYRVNTEYSSSLMRKKAFDQQTRDSMKMRAPTSSNEKRSHWYRVIDKRS